MGVCAWGSAALGPWTRGTWGGSESTAATPLEPPEHPSLGTRTSQAEGECWAWSPTSWSLQPPSRGDSRLDFEERALPYSEHSLPGTGSCFRNTAWDNTSRAQNESDASALRKRPGWERRPHVPRASKCTDAPRVRRPRPHPSSSRGALGLLFRSPGPAAPNPIPLVRLRARLLATSTVLSGPASRVSYFPL